jgi:exopolysaccharide biosynthesis operon protein EpsL
MTVSSYSRLCRGQLALLLAAVPCAAQSAPEILPGPLGGLHLSAAAGAFHDDNLFRIADDQIPFDGRRSDSARYLSALAWFDQRYGRQQLGLKARLSRVNFQHLRQLDYHGKDLSAMLDWQLGAHLAGRLGASLTDTLAPYTDLASRERNLRQHRRSHASADWAPHPLWRLRGAAARDSYRYQIARLRANERTETALEGGFEFTPPSLSTAGLLLRRVEGRYVLQGRDFTQHELKARVHWQFSPVSSVTVLAGPARRRHAQLAQRDADGVNGRATLSLQPRQRLRLNGAVWREFSALESDLASYSLNRGASAGASWDASASVRVEAAASAEQRRYPGAARDRLRNGTLTLSWSPRSALQLGLGLAQQRRRGAATLGNGSFKASTLSLSASVQF